MKSDLTDDAQLPRKYLQFPLFLIRNMFNDKEATINNIIKYGIYRMSKAIKYDLRNVARQILFEQYRGDLNHAIRKCLTRIDFQYVGKDDDYNGFSGDEFNPDLEIDELLEAFAYDAELKAHCIEFYSVRQALQVVSVTGNIEGILEIGKSIEKDIIAGQVMPMIGLHILFDFRDNDKTEKDIAQLLAYIAVRSVIGEKAYAKTNKDHIVCRMFGYASIKETIGLELAELHKKYLLRYHVEKVLKALEMDWNVCIYSNRTRGIYISISKKFPLQKLVEAAEKKKQAKREIEFEKLKQSIILTAKGTTMNAAN
jgi:hypothetical protein